ncbi:hypothetical protein [Ferruginibacter sp.]
MKKIITTLLIFSIQTGIGQNAQQFLDIFSIKQPPSYSDLKKELELYSKFQRKAEKDTLYDLDTRLLSTSYNFDKQVFEIVINYINNKIFWYRLTEYNDDSGPHFPDLLSRSPDDIEIVYIDSVFIDSLLIPYNLSNKTDFTWRDLYKDSTACFGYSWGANALWENNSLLNIIADVKQKNHTALLRQCKSLLSAVRAYGALGLYLLKQTRQPLTKEEIFLFEKIRKSDDAICTCDGCIIEVKKTSEALSDKKLKDFYFYCTQAKYFPLH